MSHPQLTGKILEIGPSDLSQAPILAIVIALDSAFSVAALRLEPPMQTDSETFSHAVISVRHEGHSFIDVADGLEITCAVTLVSDQRFSSVAPLDVSWWRGGNAAIANVSLA